MQPFWLPLPNSPEKRGPLAFSNSRQRTSAPKRRPLHTPPFSLRLWLQFLSSWTLIWYSLIWTNSDLIPFSIFFPSWKLFTGEVWWFLEHLWRTVNLPLWYGIPCIIMIYGPALLSSPLLEHSNPGWTSLACLTLPCTETCIGKVFNKYTLADRTQQR